MSLFEWLGESIDPGGIGSIQVGGRPRARRSRLAVLLSFLVSAAVLIAFYVVLWSYVELRSMAGLALATGGAIVYCLIAYFVRFQADTDNIGWLGGLIDNPFRYSDDLNRLMLFLTLVLLPGRFVSASIVDMFRLLVHAREHESTGAA